MNDLDRLQATQAQIHALDAERDEATERLDTLIRRLRTEGTTWADINKACGMTNVQMTFGRREARR